MIQAEQCFYDINNSPVRHICARVELYNGSTLVSTFKGLDSLKQLTIERIGEEKFFGFGVCQKLNVRLIDRERKITVTTANTLEVAFGIGCDYLYAFPLFYVTEVRRDEITNELSITAYDALYKANDYRVKELALQAPYTIGKFARACATKLNIPMTLAQEEQMNICFSTVYNGGANFSGEETVREALNAVAEATQTIYYVDSNWRLTFKRLDKDAEPVAQITKDNYFELDSGTNRRLAKIAHVTELGDNVSAKIAASGTTQYIRNNPFWDMADNIGELLSNAIAAVGGLLINQFSCNWRGNLLIEIGDKIALTTRDNELVNTFLLNDTIEFNGIYLQKTEWQFTDDNAEGEDNPTTIGEALKQTYARVDKANKQIELVVSDIAENKKSISSLHIETDSISATVDEAVGNIDTNTKSISSLQIETNSINATVKQAVSDINTNTKSISSLQLGTESINATVSRIIRDNEVIEENTSSLQLETDNINATVKQVNNSINNINDSLSSLSQEVSAKVSAEDVKIEISKELANGVNKVTTSTGFTFDETGLAIEKTGSEMKTQITEDGMTVYKSSEAVLTANNIGVDAVNLHATTYLIIGTNSRIEDYGSNRTGCFWIGG